MSFGLMANIPFVLRSKQVELFKSLLERKDKKPINSDVMGKMVIMSNFMNDSEQESMQQNPNNNE